MVAGPPASIDGTAARATSSLPRRVLVLGGGSLGGAIARRLAAFTEVWVVDRNQHKRDELLRAGVQQTSASADQVTASIDTIIAAVKPAHTVETVRQVASQRFSGQPARHLVSVAAGVSHSALQAVCPAGQQVVRTMMNTAVEKGAGLVAACALQTPEPWAPELDAMFRCLGDVVTVQEKNIDAVTALSACAPAFFLLAIDGLADAGVRLGLPRMVSEKLASAAAAGASVVAATQTASTARAAIISPGGSTAEGVYVLERAAVRATFQEAAEASAKRSAELGLK